MRVTTGIKFLQNTASSCFFFGFLDCLTEDHGRITWVMLYHLLHVLSFEGSVTTKSDKVGIKYVLTTYIFICNICNMYLRRY